MMERQEKSQRQHCVIVKFLIALTIVPSVKNANRK